jgi:hypothetical protein
MASNQLDMYVCTRCKDGDAKAFKESPYKMKQHLTSKSDKEHEVKWEEVQFGVDYYIKKVSKEEFNEHFPYSKGSSKGTPGDWPCPSCRFLVLASKDQCLRCGTCADDKEAPGGPGTQTHRMDANDCRERSRGPRRQATDEGKAKGKKGKDKDRGRKASQQELTGLRGREEEIQLVLARYGEGDVATFISSDALTNEVYQRMIGNYMSTLY